MAPPIRTPRSAWVDAGLQALAAGGPDAVRIDPLARALGVTRGGFYWHFDNRQSLLDEMLDTWQRRGLETVIEQVDADRGDARAKLRHLFALATAAGDLLRVDLAVRDWSRRDAKVAARLRRVDNRRMAYMRELFRAFCADEEEAEARALIAFSLWIGSRFIAADHGARSRAMVLEQALSGLLA
ncbi:MAG TPA: helix-turn-helix domain-containing protein [Conexibacter sp.]|jgi:AcrR family transcriptional regulator